MLWDKQIQIWHLTLTSTWRKQRITTEAFAYPIKMREETKVLFYVLLSRLIKSLPHHENSLKQFLVINIQTMQIKARYSDGWFKHLSQFGLSFLKEFTNKL